MALPNFVWLSKNILDSKTADLKKGHHGSTLKSWKKSGGPLKMMLAFRMRFCCSGSSQENDIGCTDDWY